MCECCWHCCSQWKVNIEFPTNQGVLSDQGEVGALWRRWWFHIVSAISGEWKISSPSHTSYPHSSNPYFSPIFTNISHKYSTICPMKCQKRNADIFIYFWALGPVLRNAPRLSFFTFSSIPSIFSIRSLFIIVINLWASLPIISVIEPTIKISTMGSLPTASPGSRHCNIVALHHSV